MCGRQQQEVAARVRTGMLRLESHNHSAVLFTCETSVSIVAVATASKERLTIEEVFHDLPAQRLGLRPCLHS